jgi:D-alanyl-D-alanine endopeptidase (penicillin-binding protein 7)
MKFSMIAGAAIFGLVLSAGVSNTFAADSEADAPKAKPAKSHHVRHHHSSRRTSVDDATHLAVRSASALVQDQSNGAILYEKNPTTVVPIASITKLMTAMVTLDAKLPLAEELTIGREDVDTLKGTRSRLKVGVTLTREELLNLALMASENRAAATLSRNYPGGRESFVAAMNHKAQELGLTETRFYDPTGLTAANVSNARDLVKMVAAAREYPLIREFSTAAHRDVMVGGRPMSFHNTNSLVRSSSWDIDLSKTGYISEAGKCLVMEAWVNDHPTIIVLLDSWGRKTRLGDANRIKRMLERGVTVAQQRPSAG